MSDLPTRPPSCVVKISGGHPLKPPAEGQSPSALPLIPPDGIRAIAFDCYGTLIEFTNPQFREAYHEICVQQSLPVDGAGLWRKWMEIWRRMAAEGRATENPRNWSPRSAFPPATGPLPPYRPYREEWPEHFQACLSELGAHGNPVAAYEHLRNRLADALAYSDAATVIDALGKNYRIGVLSNADDDFLFPCLAKNGLGFELIITSESARAYKPHAAIFRSFADAFDMSLNEILYVGDSQYADVLGAKNAGMRVAWVNRDGATRRDGVPSPDHEIGTLSGLIDPLLSSR